MATYTPYVPQVNRAVVSAVRTAFARHRTSPRLWASRKMEGRLDPRNVWRYEATSRTDIFRERNAPGATNVNLHLLVDGSGSMSQSKDQKRADGEKMLRIEAAADISATLVEAFRTQAQVRINVWMHSTNGEAGGDVAIFPIVQNGRGREVVAHMPALAGGGNGDGYAIQWVVSKMRRDHRRGDVDLLIVISDGLPSYLVQHTSRVYSGTGSGAYGVNYEADGVAHVANVVAEARERGIKVMAVAITPNANFEEMYGREGDVIPFIGDWNKLAAEFGSRLGTTLAAAKKQARR